MTRTTSRGTGQTSSASRVATSGCCSPSQSDMMVLVSDAHGVMSLAESYVTRTTHYTTLFSLSLMAAQAFGISRDRQQGLRAVEHIPMPQLATTRQESRAKRRQACWMSHYPVGRSCAVYRNRGWCHLRDRCFHQRRSGLRHRFLGAGTKNLHRTSQY